MNFERSGEHIGFTTTRVWEKNVFVYEEALGRFLRESRSSYLIQHVFAGFTR